MSFMDGQPGLVIGVQLSTQLIHAACHFLEDKGIVDQPETMGFIRMNLCQVVLYKTVTLQSLYRWISSQNFMTSY